MKAHVLLGVVALALLAGAGFAAGPVPHLRFEARLLTIPFGTYLPRHLADLPEKLIDEGKSLRQLDAFIPEERTVLLRDAKVSTIDTARLGEQIIEAAIAAPARITSSEAITLVASGSGIGSRSTTAELVSVSCRDREYVIRVRLKHKDI